MKKLLIILSLFFALCISTNAQNCDTLADCQEKLSRAAQQINKLLDVTETQEKAIKALKEEVESRKRLSEIDAEIIKKREFQLAEQEKLIGILRKETRKQLSIFWGILKIRF
jgi:septal ring factor EnvC (AmiA/AmiB activator)